MTSVDTGHRRLCHTLFDAIEQGDIAAVETCYGQIEKFIGPRPDRAPTT